LARFVLEEAYRYILAQRQSSGRVEVEEGDLAGPQ